MLYERDSISYQNHWSLLTICCSWRVIFIEIKAFLYDKKSNFLEIAQVNISFTQKGRIPTCEYPIHDIYFNHELVQKSRFFYQKNETKQVFAPKEWNRRVEFWVIAGEYKRWNINYSITKLTPLGYATMFRKIKLYLRLRIVSGNKLWNIIHKITNFFITVNHYNFSMWQKRKDIVNN